MYIWMTDCAVSRTCRKLLFSYHYNIIILEQLVIPCACNYSTMSLIYLSLMCSVFWHLDSAITSLHMTTTSWITCISIMCVTFMFSLLGPILGWYTIYFLGGPIEEHCRVWLGVTLYRHGTHLVLAWLLI